MAHLIFIKQFPGDKAFEVEKHNPQYNSFTSENSMENYPHSMSYLKNFKR